MSRQKPFNNYVSMSEAEMIHDQQVNVLYNRLHDKSRYFAVATEVPLWHKDMDRGQRGRPDVMTIDTLANRIIAWEVKTGDHKHGLKKARQQAKEFYAHMKSNPLYATWDTQFVYYNPMEEVIKRLKC